MKRLILILTLMCASLCSKAQKNVEYDTVVLYPQHLQGYPMKKNTNYFPGDFLLHKLYDKFCVGMSDEELSKKWFHIAGYPHMATGPYGVEGFAQPYHLDSAVQIIGVATKVSGGVSPNQVAWVLYDDAFNQLAYSLHYVGTVYNPVTGEWYDNTDSNGYRRYYFYNGGAPLKDFHIGLVGNATSHFGGFDYALSIWNGIDECFKSMIKDIFDVPHDSVYIGYDRLSLEHPMANVTDTVACYQAAEEDKPYFRKDGQWTAFADDSLYYIFQSTFLEFLPIVAIERNSGYLNSIELENTCSVFPNPAKDVLNILSNFKVKAVEIYNSVGVKVKEQTINNHEGKIDIRNLKAGSYVANLQTTQGVIAKKFIIE